MKKKKILGLSVVLIAAFMSGHMYISAATAEPGSSADPLVTESYMKQELAKLQSDIKNLKNQINSGNSNSGSSSNGSTSNENVGIGVGTITAKSLNIRRSASTSSESIGSLSKGDKVTLLEKSGSWYKIKYGQITGWISASYVTVDSSTGVSSNSTLGNGIITANSLNVRSGPASSYEKVGTLTKGTKVTLLEKSGSWYKVKYGSIIGWVTGEYVSI